MATLKTHGIHISADPIFQPNYSGNSAEQFIFSYTITIENKGPNTVQLLSRQWQIFDATGDRRIVEGDGVVGEQPIIEPGSRYQYNSWCPLASELGCMWGTYTMLNKDTGEKLRVQIPKFQLVADYLKN